MVESNSFQGYIATKRQELNGEHFKMLLKLSVGSKKLYLQE